MIGSSASAAKDPSGDIDLASLQDATGYLAERATKIAKVIAQLDQSTQDPNLLEDLFPDPSVRSDSDLAGNPKISNADYCFRIAGECRDKMRSIEPQLKARKSDWADHRSACIDMRCRLARRRSSSAAMMSSQVDADHSSSATTSWCETRSSQRLSTCRAASSTTACS